ncbi:MAG: hypothetical protein LPK45_07885, partial [Bacteroidota bacterium]|nr:hypothetical protein [Bacteroidota bacterium]MDX5430990.1 hypothetical protein [Bacteroidota bacterium]MDX5469741.1 hypothetical protein [Bacteroidota bacterium]
MARIIFVFLFAFPLFAWTQSKEEELAAQYYLNGEFEKAAVLYEKLWKKHPESTYLYKNYLNTLVAKKDYKEADKLIRAQQKKFPEDMAFVADEPWLLVQQGETEKGKKRALELVEKVRDDDQALGLALALLQRRFSEAGEAAFLRGRKLANDPFLFAGDLAGLYASLGRKKEMVDEGLLHVRVNAQNLEGIQHLFQDHLNGDSDWELLVKPLMQAQQKNPNDPVLSEL